MEGVFRRGGDAEASAELLRRVVGGARVEECVAASEGGVLRVCQALKVGSASC